MLSLSLWAGIGLAHGVELGFTTTAEEISLDISLRPPCHVSLGGYHTAAGYQLLLCWHISTGASQNSKKTVYLEFNTSHQTSGGAVQIKQIRQTKPLEAG